MFDRKENGLRGQGKALAGFALNRNLAIRVDHETHEIHERNRWGSEYGDASNHQKVRFLLPVICSMPLIRVIRVFRGCHRVNHSGAADQNYDQL
jgi:hypothetical protein